MVGARVVVLGAARPVVADRIGKHGAVVVELAHRYRQIALGKGLQSLARVLVPKVVGAVGAGRGKGAECGVEGDMVDRVYVEVVLAVAFEHEVLVVGGLAEDVVHRDPAFDGSDAETALVGEGGDAAGLQLALHVDGKWPLGKSQGCARCGRLSVPVPDGMVPRGCDQKVLLLAPKHVAYRSVMRGTLHRLVGCQVPYLGSFVGASGVDPRTVPGPTASKHRRVVRGRGLWHCSAVGLHLPAADLVVPGACDEKISLGRPVDA
eukprot:scaffold23285_cov113-Isochrysis_galbana.AAC.2